MMDTSLPLLVLGVSLNNYIISYSFLFTGGDLILHRNSEETYGSISG